MTLVGLNSGLTIANETAITKEGSRCLRNDSESHTTSLLDNRECNYRQSSVIVCSLLEQKCRALGVRLVATNKKFAHTSVVWFSCSNNCTGGRIIHPLVVNQKQYYQGS